ncbi:MAG: lipocalin family protein [Flavobacterium sp.]|nr:lipocalin family protein [Flavobacterium sp.]
MKNIKLLLLTSLATFLFSCSNEPVDPALLAQINTPTTVTNAGTTGGTVVSNGNFTATIDGQSFSADATAGNLITVNGANVLSITGMKPSGEYIAIQLVNPTTGIFVVNALGGNKTISYKQDATTPDIYGAFDPSTGQPTGTLTISSLNLVTNKISGTFSFVGHLLTTSTQTKQITNGVFTNISFTNSSAPVVVNPLVGNYIQTAYNTSTQTDLNNDGTTSTNQMLETNCYNDNYLILNADYTFSANSKGVDIGPSVASNVVTCYSDPSVSGTWVSSGNTVTFTYLQNGTTVVDNFTIAGNTLVINTPNSEVLSRNGNTLVQIISNVSVVYTKQ